MKRLDETDDLRLYRDGVRAAFLGRVNEALRARSRYALQLLLQGNGRVRIVRPARNITVFPAAHPPL